ncbi:MBL fold metallo-hydrolase [Peterkaempfera bronchialis]|uniref:MBL fold metallo-hydrolase n=1 Tax=Peterkaempfera bronchialis TaxID=2126346 RepID=A0A345ST51_9ACTN|nr:MBL fold metallo-hydrolase [Peterkaempfera bronchialis]AXI76906.1 MBL fold metallo-hydrolase [Peterkaempfera bronchialis]
MRLTKMGHACVRLEKDGQVLVIDPGGLTEESALDGADAVLVTHEHFDHFEEERLRRALDGNPALRLWTVGAVARQLPGYGDRVAVVGHGDTFTAAGFEVEAHGELHAVIHPAVPRIANTGFVVDGSVFHPGDALTVPGRPVETLLLPVHAPWSKASEVIDYVGEVKPQRAFALHDGLLQDVGLAVYARLIDAVQPEAHYRRLAPGEGVDLA